MSITEAVQLLKQSNSVLLVGHVKPDGDSIGCQLALAEALEQQGKEVSIQAFDPVPRLLQFLPGCERIKVTEMIAGTYDSAVLVEVPRLTRCGFTAIPANAIIGLDHHPDYELNADVDILDTSVAAAAELMYELMRELGAELTPSISQNLLTAIVTDCGFFTYSSTTPKTLDTASQLMKAGADITRIAERVRRSHPQKRLTLQTDLLKNMRYLADGACALLTADQELIQQRGYEDELFEDMVNMPLSVETIFISILGRQNHDGTWRYSLRSKASFDVGSIARAFGGGGHRNAAGFRSNQTLQEIISTLEKKVEGLLA